MEIIQQNPDNQEVVKVCLGIENSVFHIIESILS